MSKEPTANKEPKSIVLKVSISNKPDSNGNKAKSMYNRLSKYAKDKGVNEQAILRFALSSLLDRAGY
jgi:hypothetical protein